MTWSNPDLIWTFLYAAMVLAGLVTLGTMIMLFVVNRWEDEELNLHEQNTMPELRALADGQVCACIICGCDDEHACVDDEDALWIEANPCYWLRVDRELRMGICSRHPESVDAWDKGEFHQVESHGTGRA